MNLATLRNWAGAVAVSLPKKLLALLGLRAGSEVEVRVKDGSIVLSPARTRHTLAQLEKEQRALERALGRPLGDKEWLESPPRGRELLYGKRYVLVLFLGGAQPPRPVIALPISQGETLARSTGFAATLMGAGTQTQGVVICDQPRTLDFSVRAARFVEAVPAAIVDDVLGRIAPLVT